MQYLRCGQARLFVAANTYIHSTFVIILRKHFVMLYLLSFISVLEYVFNQCRDCVLGVGIKSHLNTKTITT